MDLDIPLLLALPINHINIELHTNTNMSTRNISKVLTTDTWRTSHTVLNCSCGCDHCNSQFCDYCNTNLFVCRNHESIRLIHETDEIVMTCLCWLFLRPNISHPRFYFICLILQILLIVLRSYLFTRALID